MKVTETDGKVKHAGNNIISVDEAKIHDHIGEIVREEVEIVINRLLKEESDELCNAARYQRTPERRDYRAGFRSRKFETKAGEVELKIPRLRRMPFESAIIERYRRRETSVEEALVEMYLAGVSVRRVEDITEALWGTRVSPATVSRLNAQIYEDIEKWLKKPIECKHPYVYLDGLWLKRTWGSEMENVSILVAMGVDEDGFRRVLAVREGAKEDKESWLLFLRELKERGLSGTQLFISDKCLGLLEALCEVYPEAKWQRCVVHFYRNVFTCVPRGKMKEVAAMLKAIHAQEDREAARGKAEQVVEKLEAMNLKSAAKVVRDGAEETFSYYEFPSEHWRKIRTNNPLERVIKEIRRRTRVVGAFPDGRSAVMLAAARLRYMAGKKWGTVRYMSMDSLVEKA